MEVTAESSNRVEPVDPVLAATHAQRRVRVEQLDAVHRSVTEKVWLRRGFRSPRGWLVAVTGESFGWCSVTLLLAERMQVMPVARAAFVDGVLSESGLRLLAEAWTETVAEVFVRDEEMLVGWACRLPLRDARTVIDTWVAHADPERFEREERERFDRRRFHLSDLMDGMGKGDFLLDREGTRVVRDAIDFLGRPVAGDTRDRAQRHADALVAMATMVTTRPPADQAVGARRTTPKLVATIDYWGLTDRAGVGTIDAAHSGPAVVTAEAIRRLACDAGVHRYVTDTPDAKVHYGRETRTISDPLFDILTVRDHGCRWGACPIPAAMCDAHHADHWLDLGETEPDNLILLCWYHHHLLHEQHWRIQPLGAGHFQLHDPDGTPTSLLRPPIIGAQLPLHLDLDLTPAA